jgi:hypothetical protein
MAIQTATNPETGERIALVGDKWQPVAQSATNDKGVKAFLVNDKWLVDEPTKVTEKRQMVDAELRSAVAPFAGLSKGVGNVMFGGQRLVGKGLQAIGADETGQALIQDAARRQAEQEAFIAPYREVAPAMTGTGEFTGEVIGTLPAGGVIAKGVSKIPGAGRIAEAIRTGGFSTGAPVATTLSGRAADIATRATGGAVVGGTSAALINPEEAGAGAAFGAAVPFVLPVAMQKIASGVGKLADIRQIPTQKAANILRESVGGSVDEVVNALRNAKPGQTPAQALAEAGLNEPVAQSLLQRAVERDPKFFTDLFKRQDVVTANALSELAGGKTETLTRNTLSNMKNALNAMTEPQKQFALNRVNLGKDIAAFEKQAGKLGGEAAKQVQKVRDLISAGNSAEAWARLQMIKQNLPVGAARYTFADELARKAGGQWSDAAAQGSLDAGQMARAYKGASDALRSTDIKPLETAPLVDNILAIGRNPTLAGNDLIEASIARLADDMAKWTAVDGIIPGEALDAIRKNSVNAAIRDVMKGVDPTTQQQAAASVMAKIKPFIIDAIENAGGTGYRQYLANYAKGAQNIAARKLSAEARTLYRDSPDLFVKLVEGNSPKAVEEIMGKGNYDLALQLSQDALDTLKTASTQVATRGEIAKQATAGEKALVDLMSEHSSVLKIPNWFDPRITTANKALDIVEKKVGKATLKKLTEAAKNVDNFEQLLGTLPASERNAVLKAMKDPKVWEKLKDTDVPRAVTSGAVNLTTPPTNALAPEQQNQNALRR